MVPSGRGIGVMVPSGRGIGRPIICLAEVTEHFMASTFLG